MCWEQTEFIPHLDLFLSFSNITLLGTLSSLAKHKEGTVSICVLTLSQICSACELANFPSNIQIPQVKKSEALSLWYFRECQFYK